MSVTILKGSIFEVEADALVNPANGHLRHGGGLAARIDQTARGGYIATDSPDDAANMGRRRAAAIESRGGYEAAKSQWSVSHNTAPLIATGNVHVMGAGLLPYRSVIHAVGPVYNGGLYMEHDLLELTMDSVLKACVLCGFESVAVPAISCGIFGFPYVEAAEILVEVASWYDDVHTTFALTDDDHFAAFTASMLTVEARNG